MKDYIKKLLNQQNLTKEEAALAMAAIMQGEASEAQIGSFMTALSMKGECIEEITGCAAMMRQMGERLLLEGDVIDLVGTGGDGSHTFNISTLASLVVAASGQKVAKHGNRGVTSTCGSADLIEDLGIPLNLSPRHNQEIFEEMGICFMFAPLYHGCMRHAAKPRRELGVKSIFNLLGPLANPAQTTHILLGVYDEKWVVPLAEVLCQLGTKGAMVVHGRDGLDEVSMTGETVVCEVRQGQIATYVLTPEQFGLTRCRLSELSGGDRSHHLDIAKAVISGSGTSAQMDAVVLNAACALYVANQVESITEGVQRAKTVLASGVVLSYVEKLIAVSKAKEAPHVS
ncbi:MAG: anthranilate phosphoribosyltransferase [Cellulosilyticaceae bacterium]